MRSLNETVIQKESFYALANPPMLKRAASSQKDSCRMTCLRGRLKIQQITMMIALAMVINTHAQTQPHIRLHADHQTLGAVLENFQRLSGIRLLFANSMVDSFQVSGTLTGEPREVLNELLRATPFLALQKSRELWVIAPRARSTQQLVLSGTVIDANDLKPLEGAEVYIPHTPQGVTTDSLGRFQLREVALGEQRVIVKRIGYEDYAATLSLTHDSSHALNIALAQKPVAAPEVVVEEKRLAPISTTILAQQVLPKAQLTLPPVRNDGEVFELLHLQPGVSRREAEDVFPHVEGGSATEVGIELDGMPVFVPTYSRNRRSIFSSATIEALVLHRSGYGAQFGEAMSGIVALASRAIRAIPYRMHLSASSNGFGLGAKAVAERWSYSGLGRVSNLERELDWRNFSANDFFNKLEYRPANNSALTLLALVSRGAFTESNSLASQHTLSHSLGLRYETQAHARSFAALLYHSGLASLQREAGFKADFTQTLPAALRIKAGLHYLALASEHYAAADSVLTFKYLPDVIGNPNENGALLFTQNARLLSPYFELAAEHKYWSSALGMRVPVHVRSGNAWGEPRAQFTLKPHATLQLTLATGKYHQFTDRSYASEVKSGDEAGAGEYVIKALSERPSQAWHWRAELAQRVHPEVVVALAAFKKKYAFNDHFYLSRINYQIWQIPLSRGATTGTEFWLAKTRGWFQGWVSYTLHHQRYTSASGATFRPYFHRAKIFNAAFTHFVLDRWQLKSSYTSLSGFPGRDWIPGRIDVQPDASAEEFAQTFLSYDRSAGSRTQFALGLSWLFAGGDKPHTLEIIGVNMQEEEIATRLLQSSFKLWLGAQFFY